MGGEPRRRARVGLREPAGQRLDQRGQAALHRLHTGACGGRHTGGRGFNLRRRTGDRHVPHRARGAVLGVWPGRPCRRDGRDRRHLLAGGARGDRRHQLPAGGGGHGLRAGVRRAVAKADPRGVGVSAGPVAPATGGGAAARASADAVSWWKRPEIYLPVLAVVVFLAAWEVFGRLSNPILFAPPSAVAAAFFDLTASGRLPRALVVTLHALATGFVLSLVTGLLTGLALGRNPTLARVVEPYIDAIYATPRVVITPLVILWFGVGFWGRVFIIWIGGVVPIILNTAIGVRNARPDLIEVARSFQASERDLVRHVILPGAVPYVLAGLRISAGRLLLGVVIAEIFLDLTGVGGIIQTESAYFRTARMLVGVLVFAVLGILFIGAFDILEKRFSSWKAQGST
ncbi:MAG: ABC transporter permease subunit [Nitriliruptorales bacterium]|nr:ABC transporter permease subunit [Nitriliruptorales bacterium]